MSAEMPKEYCPKVCQPVRGRTGFVRASTCPWRWAGPTCAGRERKFQSVVGGRRGSAV